MPKSNCNCRGAHCDCNEAAPTGDTTLAILARNIGGVVSGRVTKATARALGNYCSTHNCTQSEALRTALTVLAAAGDDPTKSLAAVAVALGLDADAGPEDIDAAWQALLGQVSDSASGSGSAYTKPADPSAPGADPKKPPPGTSASLSAAAQARLNRQNERDERQAAVRESLTRSPANVAAAKRAGLTPEQFAAEKMKFRRV